MPHIFEVALDSIKKFPGGEYDRDYHSLEALGIFMHHVSNIFPEGSNETLTFTAGDANAFGAWAEITDSATNTFSSKITSDTYICALLIEDTSIRDKVYVIEVAYGVAKTISLRYRFLSGETVFLPAIQQIRIRSRIIPTGETVYYRMKCETASATCQLHLRYYYR